MSESEIIESLNPKDLLKLVLKGMEIQVLTEKENMLEVENNYTIEVEGKSLYKLMHKGQVVAPFSDVVEMCGFIKMG